MCAKAGARGAARRGEIRQITVPLRPRKKQTFAIEWESSLNTAAHCAALVWGSILFCVSFSRKKDKKKIIVFLMGKSHFGLYILALSLFGKEVGSRYVCISMNGLFARLIWCFNEYFEWNEERKKKVFSFDLKQQFFSCIHNIYLH